MTTQKTISGDCLPILRKMPTDSVDLVFCSPPYEDSRSYSIEFCLYGSAWVDWCLPRYLECVRVCRGLVCFVVDAKTRNYQWSPTPAILMTELHSRGVKLRKPPIYHRVGVPGSGGPDWWRNDYELIVCSSKGKLPWSDNTATGHAPKYPVGGRMRNRRKDGSRELQTYKLPAKSNPGNVVKCIVGGGVLGSKLAHLNEAPFPELLVEPFIRSFCPPGGIVLDPFCGSGTTLAVATRLGRSSIGIDLRKDQTALTRKRIKEAKDKLRDDERATTKSNSNSGT